MLYLRGRVYWTEFILMGEARRKRQRETLTWSMMGRISTSERNRRVRLIWLGHVRQRTYEGIGWISLQWQSACRRESGHFRIDGTRIGSEVLHG